MKTWSGTILAIFVLGIFAYVTFIKENPVSPWWWILGSLFFTQIVLHDAVVDDSNNDDEDSGSADEKE